MKKIDLFLEKAEFIFTAPGDLSPDEKIKVVFTKQGYKEYASYVVWDDEMILTDWYSTEATEMVAMDVLQIYFEQL